jgi:hypothetical protein
VIVPIDRRVIGLVARPAIALAGHLVIVPVGRPARVASPSGDARLGQETSLSEGARLAEAANRSGVARPASSGRRVPADVSRPDDRPPRLL